MEAQVFTKLDMGATNHMSGCNRSFLDIYRRVHGSVRFGDGSEASNKGSGTVIFQGKNGEHTPLTRVYYIPRLTTNIVSVGQLDEGGCNVRINNGVLQIRDDDNRLLVKVNRSGNRLYLLCITVTCPLCLSTRRDEGAWLWHQRYGHLHFDALRKLSQKQMVHGLPSFEHVH